MITEHSDRMLRLFKGNDRSSGRFNPGTERMHVEYVPVDAEAMDAHLDGTGGVGVVPIMDDGTCLWAAIDIDNHGQDEDLPIVDKERLARQLHLPLVLCRSKSGGIHAYIFFTQPQQASHVRHFLAEWAVKLGYPGAEIFPKQSRLTTHSGKMSYGNWINLPYMGGDNTNRYAVVDGEHLTTSEFLDYADKMKVTPTQFKAFFMSEHPDAPPCIQSLMMEGVSKGARNEAMYNVVVYFRKRDTTTAEASAIEANQYLFKTPLPKSELGRTIASALRPDYSYRCNQDVIKSICDREACLKRKCGITQDEATKTDTEGQLPVFTDLTKYLTEPVRWELVVDGVRIYNISTPQLLDWRAIRELVADRLTKIIPSIKNGEWEAMLAQLMASCRLIETPDDASTTGIIRDRLREFCSKADFTDMGKNPDSRKALLRGMPVVQEEMGERCIMFRGQDFVNYLKRTKSEELKGVSLWFAVQSLGVEHKKVRVTGTKESCNVWYVPVKVVVQDFAAEQIDFKAEL